jgi:glycogen synthase
MKILQVTDFFKPSWESGGPARVAYEISKKLIERGHEVTVYTTDGFKSRLDVEKNVPVDINGIKTSDEFERQLFEECCGTKEVLQIKKASDVIRSLKARVRSY